MIRYLEDKPHLIIPKLLTYGDIGKAYSAINREDSAAIAYKKSIKLFELEPKILEDAPDIFVHIVKGMVNIDKKTESYDKAIKTLYKSLETLNDFSPKYKSDIYNELGYAYWYINDFKEAEILFKKALDIPEKSDFTKYTSYMGLGDVQINNNLDSALYYYMKVLPYFKNHSTKNKFYINKTNIANVLIKKGQLNEAEKTLILVRNYYLKNNLKSNLDDVYLLLSEIALLKKDTSKILKYLKKAEPIIENQGKLLSLEKLYGGYVDYYKENKNINLTNFYSKKHKQIRDSIYSKEKRMLIEVYKTKHLNKINKAKIETQNLLISSQKKQKKHLTIGVTLLIISIGFLLFFYKLKLKTQKELFEKKEELATEKVNTIIETQKTKAIQSRLQGQNKERERIAKDLHDTISGNLAAIKMKLANIKEYQSQEVEAIISSIDATYHEVRNISHNLIPKKIDQESFIIILNQLIQLYQSDNLNLILEAFPENRLNKINSKTQIELYRIIQELITNIVKHAKASKGLINITLHENYLNLLIEDNGIGFDSKKKYTSIGLSNIKSRITVLNGNIEIDSQIKKGTTININIPITNE